MEDLGMGRGAGTDDQASSAEGTSGTSMNTFLTLSAIVAIIGVVAAIATGSGEWILLTIVCVALLFYWLTPSDRQEAVGRDAEGHLVLQQGSARPVSEAERSRLLDEEVGTYMRDGYFVRQRTTSTAQLVKPKRFSFVWAFLWLLVFGVGIIVYLIYYAAKQDEGRYVEVDEYGTVRATRQVRHVL